MNEEQFVQEVEAIIGKGNDLVTADDWTNFALNLFKAVEKAAASQGAWAEFDSAMMAFRSQLNDRIKLGRWE